MLGQVPSPEVDLASIVEGAIDSLDWITAAAVLVGVQYATDLAQARDVLLDAVRGVDVVAANPAPDAAIAEFGDSRIDFHLRFWHGSTDHDRFMATGRVALAVKETFNRTGITIAFPQRVLWTGEPSTDGSGD